MRPTIAVLIVLTSGCNCFVTRTGRSIAAPRLHHQLRVSNDDSLVAAEDVILPDYLITDSVGKTDRPPLLDTVFLPRNIPKVLLIGVGFGVAGFNVLGRYDQGFSTLTALVVVLGIVSASVDLFGLLSPVRDARDRISPNVRAGGVDDALIHYFSAVYTLSGCWLAMRTSFICPDWLSQFDPLMGLFALASFALSLAAPLLTLLHDEFGNLEAPMRQMVRLARGDYVNDSAPIPAMTDTEVFRVRGFLAIGLVGVLYCPETVMLITRGQEWWSRVTEVYPSQPLVESCTSMFGILATQVAMLSFRIGKKGVATFRTVVPAVGVLCLLLAVFPCVFLLYWLGGDISFFDLYQM